LYLGTFVHSSSDSLAQAFQAMAPATEMKRPASSYFMWFNSAREQICKDLGTKTLGVVGKKAGEMWKAMSPAAKAPWEAKAKEQREAFDKFKATDAGQKALEEKQAERKDAKQEKMQKNAKKAAKAVEKDEKLKKPASAYFIFSNEMRATVQKQLGTTDFGNVTKKTVEMWKALTDSTRKPWDEKAKAQKDAYDKYVASPEGAAALQAYKDQVKEAKDSIKGVSAKHAADAEEPEKKRAKTASAGA